MRARSNFLFSVQETKKQHHDIVSVYRMHLLYAVQVNSVFTCTFRTKGTIQVTITELAPRVLSWPLARCLCSGPDGRGRAESLEADSDDVQSAGPNQGHLLRQKEGDPLPSATPSNSDTRCLRKKTCTTPTFCFLFVAFVSRQRPAKLDVSVQEPATNQPVCSFCSVRTQKEERSLALTFEVSVFWYNRFFYSVVCMYFS